ncbi:MAG: FtsX-like permease family protein [Alistipes sp.]
MLSQLFARRYLFSPKSHSVINLISGLSVVSVAMPVAAMIILLSVFNGFETLVKSMCSAFDADLTISVRQGQTFDPAALDTMALRRVAGVEALSFVLEQSALLEHGDRQATTLMRGVDDAYAEVFPIAETVLSGDYQVRLGDLDRLVLGQAMAYRLGIHSLADGDVSIYALRRSGFSSLLPLDSYSKRTLETAGVFTLDLDTEQTYALTSLRLTQELFSYPNRVSLLVLRLTDPATAAAVKQLVEPIVGDGFKVQTRYEMKSTFYNIMTYEKWGIFLISLLVLIIASFSIVGSLAMLIIEKRRDIHILRAMGADTRLIRSIFRGEGLLISAMGATMGVVLGVGASLLQQHFGIIEIPAETFLLKSYPVEFRLTDLLVVLAAFTVVTTLISRLTVQSMIKQK